MCGCQHQTHRKWSLITICDTQFELPATVPSRLSTTTLRYPEIDGRVILAKYNLNTLTDSAFYHPSTIERLFTNVLLTCTTLLTTSVHATTTLVNIRGGCVPRSHCEFPPCDLSLDLHAHQYVMANMFGQEASSSVGECRIARVRSDQPCTAYAILSEWSLGRAKQ